MKRVFAISGISVILLMILIVLIQFQGAKKAHETPNQLFKTPTNKAQEVANFVFAKGEIDTFNVGEPNEGVTHSYRFYVAFDIYELEVNIYKNGRKDLRISHYVTNRPLGKLKTPADLVAEELIYGRSEIMIEEHISDYEIDMSVNIFQAFTKKRNNVLIGFTREEKDSKTSGVQEHLYHDGQELENETWKTVSKEKAAEIAKNYQEILASVLKILEKR